MNEDPDGLYYLFITVGGFASSNVDKTGFNSWKSMIDLNLNISFLLAKHFIRKIQNTSGGSICFTSAYTSIKEEAGKSAYGASKAALNYLARTVAKEGEGINLTSNVLLPFVLDTEENRQWMEDSAKMISPKEIGKVVNNIFSDHMNNNGRLIILPDNIDR